MFLKNFLTIEIHLEFKILHVIYEYFICIFHINVYYLWQMINLLSYFCLIWFFWVVLQDTALDLMYTVTLKQTKNPLTQSWDSIFDEAFTFW